MIIFENIVVFCIDKPQYVVYNRYHKNEIANFGCFRRMKNGLI